MRYMKNIPIHPYYYYYYYYYYYHSPKITTPILTLLANLPEVAAWSSISSKALALS